MPFVEAIKRLKADYPFTVDVPGYNPRHHERPPEIAKSFSGEMASWPYGERPYTGRTFGFRSPEDSQLFVDLFLRRWGL